MSLNVHIYEEIHCTFHTTIDPFHVTKNEKNQIFVLNFLQNVMDGDLCEQFTSLDLAKQKTIATDLGRTPNEVAKKLEDIRTRYAF